MPKTIIMNTTDFIGILDETFNYLFQEPTSDCLDSVNDILRTNIQDLSGINLKPYYSKVIDYAITVKYATIPCIAELICNMVFYEGEYNRSIKNISQYLGMYTPTHGFGGIFYSDFRDHATLNDSTKLREEFLNFIYRTSKLVLSFIIDKYKKGPVYSYLYNLPALYAIYTYYNHIGNLDETLLLRIPGLYDTPLYSSILDHTDEFISSMKTKNWNVIYRYIVDNSYFGD